MKNVLNYTITVQSDNIIQANADGIPSQPGKLSLEELELAIHYVEAVNDNVLNKRDQFQNLGKRLFSTIFPEPIKGHFHEQAWRKIIESLTESLFLRLQIIFQRGVLPRIMSLPWEFLYYAEADTFLGTYPKVALSYSIESVYTRSTPATSDKTLRMLLIHTHPKNLDGIGVIAVRNAIKDLENLKHVEIKELEDPAVSEIREVIGDFRPHIFHFLGHGEFKENSGTLALLDRENNALWYDSQSFSEFFQAWTPHLCILQSCNSGAISEYTAFTGTANWIVNRNIPFVIAMRYPFKQGIGWTFIKNFYKELCEGSPIDLAAQQGRRALAIVDFGASHANRDFGAPVVWSCGQANELLKAVGAVETIHAKNLNIGHDIIQLRYLTGKGFKADTLTSEKQKIRQRYFKRLRENIGFVKISQITPDQSDEIPLEKVYIPLPISLVLNLKIRTRSIERWDIQNIIGDQSYLSGIGGHGEERQRFDDMGVKIILDNAQAIIDGTIEDNPYNTKRPLILSPIWEDQSIRDYYTLEAIDAVAAIEKLVILGDPGSGKSTFAKHLALSLLVPQLVPLPDDISILGGLKNWPHGLFIPIYLELRQFVLSEFFPDLDKDVTTEHFCSYIKQSILQNDKILSNDLFENFEQGNVIIIMDGLDEVPVPLNIPNAEQKRGKQLQSLVRSLAIQYQACRIVITSRPYAYENWKLDDFQTVTLIPLKYEQKFQLTTNIYYHTSDQKDMIMVREKALRLLDSLTNIPNSLTDRPLFLTLLAILFYKNESLGLEGLPTRRGALINKNISLLLGRWTETRSGAPIIKLLGCTEQELYEHLENIAFRIHSKTEQSSDAPIIDLDIILVELFKLGKHVNPHEVLAYISQTAGILVSPYSGGYRFAHRMFQEFMAASYLSKQDYRAIKELVESQPSTWREVLRLLGDVFSETNKKFELWGLIDVLLEKESSQVLSSSDKHWISVWLASQLYSEQELYNEKLSTLQKNICTRLQSRIKNLLQTPMALSPIERVNCAKTLSIIGDDRKGVGLNQDGIPEIDWCKISEGEFQVGTSQEQINYIQKQPWATGWQFNREIPDFIAYVPTFYISRYLVTQLQFKAFVDATDGYYNDAWWTPEGNNWQKQATPPTVMNSKTDANMPQVEVRWYEAVAFCNWLGDKLNKKVRLPTEIEWEKAARGTDGRIFPWGNQFNAVYCNVAETGIGGHSPVGCFPFPNSPWDKETPLDMTGNVWEWCTTICEIQDVKKYQYPYDPDDGREDLHAPENHLRVVRGGYYLNKNFFVRVTYRGRDKPSVKLPYEGFRVVFSEIDADMSKP